jgi:hypothetical protein
MNHNSQPERLQYWAVTFDGRPPGAGGQLNTAGWPSTDRAYAIAQAIDKAMRQGIDMSHMRVFQRLEITVKSEWAEDDAAIDDQELIDDIIKDIQQIDGHTFPDQL